MLEKDLPGNLLNLKDLLKTKSISTIYCYGHDHMVVQFKSISVIVFDFRQWQGMI
jgi:predicted PilT family ATPase